MAFERIEAFPSEPGTGSPGGRYGSPARRYTLTVLLCIALLTAVRLAALAFSHTELFFDEAQYWFWSRDLAFGYYSKPPLIGWIIRASTEICGMGEACIRAPAPLIHGATAMLVYAIGRSLYEVRTGFWAALVYATLPGVSFSSTLISTDIPLLFFVALALWAVVKLTAARSWGWTAVLGLAVGGGLLAKYAMAYFLLGLVVYGAFTKEGRALLRTPHPYVALVIGAAMIAPNIAWNAAHKFATFSHTADNAAWSGTLLHPGQMAEFLGAQFGVFGPVLFAVLLVTAVRWVFPPSASPALPAPGAPERLLLAFSIPVLALMTVQALVSRAHANWAAFAYIAATVLVTAVMLRAGRTWLLRFSLGLHLAVAGVLAVGGAFADNLALPLAGNPYARVKGWKALAGVVGAKARAGGFRAIAADRRAFSAEFSYYLRDLGMPVVALRLGTVSDHFELTRPLTNETPRPVLLVSLKKARRSAASPVWANPVGSTELTVGGRRRRIYFYAIKGNVE